MPLIINFIKIKIADKLMGLKKIFIRIAWFAIEKNIQIYILGSKILILLIEGGEGGMEWRRRGVLYLIY